VISRRRFLAHAGVLAALAALPREALAMGRTPTGGALSFRLPWPTTSLDPHELGDPLAALFAPAIVDSLYAVDGATPYPTLAAAMPTREGAVTVVRLRDGLRTASGAPIEALDVARSIERSRARGGAALLADVPVARVKKGDRLALELRGALDPGKLARVLASPLVAIVPRRFSPSAPDGTGAFRATLGAGGLVLARNPNAARGASFLDRIDVARADDLKASLRAFEAERDDVGWLGTGLFDGRKGAVKFDFGPVAWIVLATGESAGAFGMPGVAQQLVDAVPPDRLAHLGLGPLPRPVGDPGWGGPPAELLVDESSVHLVEVARALAPALSRPGHEVTLAPVSRAELVRRRDKGKLVLAVDVVRPLGPGPLLALAALATLDDRARARDLVRHPPRIAEGTSMRALTSTLRLGVVGELRVAGGTAPDVVLSRSASGEGWDLGASYRRSRR
jgi:peptide/nickel transport system substrate-binding protein